MHIIDAWHLMHLSSCLIHSRSVDALAEPSEFDCLPLMTVCRAIPAPPGRARFTNIQGNVLGAFFGFWLAAGEADVAANIAPSDMVVVPLC